MQLKSGPILNCPTAQEHTAYPFPVSHPPILSVMAVLDTTWPMWNFFVTYLLGPDLQFQKHWLRDVICCIGNILHNSVNCRLWSTRNRQKLFESILRNPHTTFAVMKMWWNILEVGNVSFVYPLLPDYHYVWYWCGLHTLNKSGLHNYCLREMHEICLYIVQTAIRIFKCI